MHNVTHVEAHIKILQIETFKRSLQNTAEIIVRVLHVSKGEESNPANASEGTLPMQ